MVSQLLENVQIKLHKLIFLMLLIQQHLTQVILLIGVMALQILLVLLGQLYLIPIK